MKTKLCISIFFALFMVLFCSFTHANGNGFPINDDNNGSANETFQSTLYNEEEQIYIYMDFTNQAMIIPGQDIFGEMAGYLKAKYDSRYWMITSAEIDKKGRTAMLEIINDYGSEDLTATLTYNPKDSTYTLRQGQGSIIKFAKNRKWQKLPKELTFKLLGTR